MPRAGRAGVLLLLRLRRAGGPVSLVGVPRAASSPAPLAPFGARGVSSSLLSLLPRPVAAVPSPAAAARASWPVRGGGSSLAFHSGRLTTTPMAAANGARAASAAAAAEPEQQPPQQQQQPQQQPEQPPQQAQQQQQQQQQPQYNPPPQPPGVRRTFYRRVLPTPPATAFSSPEGKRLFAEALAQGTMAGFFPLIEQYSTQDEPAFCGLSSLTMVLNALAIDPRRPWKGAWRWFHERLLDCCLPLSAVAAQGVTLDQAACLARCNGAVVELRRSGDFGLDEFRAAVADACATGERHLVVSYARGAFGQTGDGHFSPVGGYHAHLDLALILDTARFKYPPHWVPVPMLFEAMKPHDKATGLPRGWLRLSAPAHPQDSVLFTLDVREHGRWRAAERLARGGAAGAARGALGRLAATATTAEDVVRAVVRAAAASAPTRGSVGDFVAVRLAARERAVDQQCDGGGGGGDGGDGAGAPVAAAPVAVVDSEPCVPLGKRDQLLAELRHMPLFALVSDALEEAEGAGAPQSPCHGHDHDHDAPLREAAQVAAPPGGEDGLLAEKLTVLLFLVDPKQWPGADEWRRAAAAAAAAAGGGGGAKEEEAEAEAEAQAARFAALLDVSSVSMVEAEVRYMREQLRHLDAVLGVGGGGAEGLGADGGGAQAAAAQPLPPPPPRASNDGGASDCGKCFTPLDCHVKGHHKQ